MTDPVAQQSSPKTPRHKVLVTGSAGAIGTAVVKELKARGHTVRGLDLRPTPGVEDAIVGPISDPAVIDRAVTGMTAIVHLAATTDDADFMTQLLPNNIIAVHYILDAALRHGVRRVALASSMQVTMGLKKAEIERLISPHESAPTNGYAVTKLFAEDIGHMYALRHGIGVVCARIGFLPRNPETAQHFKTKPWSQNIYLSHDDAGRFFAQAIEWPDVKYAVLWALSKRKSANGYDLDPSKHAIGYEPQDMFPQGLPFAV